MKNEVLLALVLKAVEERLENFSLDTTRFRGPRGFRGEAGENGSDGKPFIFSEHEEQIKSWVKEFSFKFKDLTEEEIEKLRGPSGKDGADGKSFIFDENKDQIQNIICEIIDTLREDFKLKFEDLKDHEIDLLKGPKGKDGRDGKSISFDDLSEEQKSELKLKFKDLTAEDIYKLKLKFSDLIPEEISNLKLKFDDLSEDERMLLRGPRGQRGKQGSVGDSGESAYGSAVRNGFIGSEQDWLDSLRGPQGISGKDGISITGARGPIGLSGKDGINGKDAPFIVDVEVVQEKQYVKFIFKFSDGSEIETNEFKIPTSTITYSPMVIGAGSSSSGSGGSGSTFQYLFGSGTPNISLGLDGDLYQNTTNGDQYKKISGVWVLQGNLTGPQGPQGIQGPVGPQGPAGSGGTQLLQNVVCDSSVYVGAVVRMTKINEVPSMMSDWPLLAAVTLISYTEYDTVVVNSQANSYPSSFSTGVVVNKPTSTTCDIALAGDTGEVFIGLDVTREYYLSSSIAGRIVASFEVPNNPSNVYIRIGKAISSKKLFVDIGERILRA
jgi:hypothetical protein